jgi:hypothetical protein
MLLGDNNMYGELIEKKLIQLIDSCSTKSDDFTHTFIEFLKNLEVEFVEFNGDGYYWGKQITIDTVSTPFTTKGVCFELEYSPSRIVVYTGLHNGYYPESYLNLQLGEYLFDELQMALSSLLSKVFGLDIKGFL